MNKFIILWVMLFLSFNVTSFAADKKEQGIEVVGYGVVEVKPDVFSVRIKVKERNVSATKSQQLVEYKIQLIANSAKSFVSKRSDIHLLAIYSQAVELAPSISVNGVISKQRFANGGQGGVFVSTNNLNQASNQSINTHNIVMETSQEIIVKLPSFSQYNQFIDRIIKVGVNHISPVESSLSQQDVFYQQALDLAMKNAQQKAKKLASVMQVNLGQLIFLKEKQPNKSKPDEMNHSTRSLLVKAEIIARFAIEN